MISVGQAQEVIRARTSPLNAEAVPLSEVHGRILREEISAPEDVPPFDRSAMDGYVLRTDDPAESYEVIGEIRAGEMVDAELQPGQAMRIFTGARLPGRGLKVVMQEDVEAQGPRMRILQKSQRSHVRPRGEDARVGEVLLAPGMILNAAAVALLASVGKISPQVSRQPRVLHLTTGDEIVAPEQPLVPGQIRNSNAFLLSALCREFGAGEVTSLHAPDHLETMIERVRQAEPQNYDMLLVSGGSGAGKYDFAAEMMRSWQTEIHFRQVDVRPGKPLIFGTTGKQLVFGLPGNALSHFVCFHLFLRTALGALLAKAPEACGSAGLGETLSDTMNSRETWWPVRTTSQAGWLEAHPVTWKSSGDITRLSGADGLIRVPAGTPHLPVGAIVEYLPTRS